MNHAWDGAMTKLRIWIYRIIGFQTLEFQKKYRIFSLFYSFLVIGLIIIMEINEINKLSDYAAHFSKVYERTMLPYSFNKMITAVLAVSAEAYFNVKEREKLYENFVRIHEVFDKQTFKVFNVLSRTNNIFLIYLLIKIAQTILACWSHNMNISVSTILLNTFLADLMILQIVSQIDACKLYLTWIHQTILNTSPMAIAQSKIDLRPTSLYLDAMDYDRADLLIKHRVDIKDQMKVYHLLIENMKLISQRFAFTVSNIQSDLHYRFTLYIFPTNIVVK